MTISAVATSMGIPLRGGRLVAEGDFDFRGTLGIAKEVPPGFTAIRLRVELDTDASHEERAKLLEVSERYCAVLQTLRAAPPGIGSIWPTTTMRRLTGQARRRGTTGRTLPREVRVGVSRTILSVPVSRISSAMKR